MDFLLLPSGGLFHYYLCLALKSCPLMVSMVLDHLNLTYLGTSLAVQWLRLPLPAQGCGSAPDWGVEITVKKQKYFLKRSNIVTNLIKTLKMINIKKKILKNKSKTLHASSRSEASIGYVKCFAHQKIKILFQF